jgi:hypothetical protein
MSQSQCVWLAINLQMFAVFVSEEFHLLFFKKAQFEP